MTDRMTYKDYVASRKAQGETNDCTVIACAAVSGMPYDEMHELLRKAGRKKGKGFAITKYSQVLRDQGFTVEEITASIKSKTVRTIERELAEKWGGCKVMINVRRHVLAWDGHEIVDWSAGRIHRINCVHLIYKGDRPIPKPVPVPERKPLKKTHRPTTAVVVYCEKLGYKAKQYRSVAAAYRANDWDLRGHQGIRKRIKTYGTWEFPVAEGDGYWGCPEYDVIMHTDDERGREAYNRWYAKT